MDLSKLEDFILDKMIASHIPAVSLTMFNRSGSYERHFGFKDLSSRQAPDAETLYGIGSITKVFTALAIMQLRDRGLLSLEDPVGHHIKGLSFFGEQVQIKHLLSHSSGLPALGFSESKMSISWWMDGYPISSLADLISFMQGAEDWTVAEPGERWFYLNEGYLLLGAIIESITSRPYVEVIQEQLLQPLGMERSFFTRAEVVLDLNKVTPYMRGRDGRHFVGSNLYSELPAAGGLVSTSADMTRLARMFVDNAEGDAAPPLISSASLALMAEAFVPVAAKSLLVPEQKSFNGFGLVRHQGFFKHDVQGHGGGVMGGTSYLAFIPEEGSAVVLLANAHGYPMLQLALACLATLQGQDIAALSFVQVDEILGALEGSYASFKDTIRAVVARRGSGLELKLTFHHEDRLVQLFPLSLGAEISRFRTFSGGREGELEFVLTKNRCELIYERYVFRKT